MKLMRHGNPVDTENIFKLRNTRKDNSSFFSCIILGIWKGPDLEEGVLALVQVCHSGCVALNIPHPLWASVFSNIKYRE